MNAEPQIDFLASRRRALRALGLAAAWPSMAAAQVVAPEDDPAAKAIVEKADLVRFPAESFEIDVDVTNMNDGEVTDKRKYTVLSKGNENTIVQVVEPAADRGQVMLMRGRDLWVFMPNISQPVRLSLSQRLTGQVANGDLARANFAGDYRPRLLRTEKVDNADCHVLELIAIDRGVTYARVLYWVRQSNFHPVRAEFYSVSERLLKTCHYENFKSLGGRVRPTRLVLQDALKKGEESTLDYSGLKPRDLPDRMFTKEYLRRL
jgi:outer membrane lipoprotein-sorting protein